MIPVCSSMVVFYCSGAIWRKFQMWNCNEWAGKSNHWLMYGYGKITADSLPPSSYPLYCGHLGLPLSLLPHPYLSLSSPLPLPYLFITSSCLSLRFCPCPYLPTFTKEHTNRLPTNGTNGTNERKKERAHNDGENVYVSSK